MRIFKGIIGWLCFLSLLAVPASILFWLWAFAYPFLNGATVSQLPEPDVRVLSQSIADHGVNSSANPLLKALVEKTDVPVWTHTGTLAAGNVLATQDLSQWTHGEEATGMHSAAAALLLDTTDRVVAAYPVSMVGLRTNTKNLPYVPHAVHALLTTIIGHNGQAIGTLVVYTNDNRLVESIRPDQKTPQWLVDISGITPDRNITNLLIRSIVFLSLFYLLLPAWVAMDAAWRGMRPAAWGILVFLTSIIGLFAYLIARLPSPRPCPNCGEKVFGKFIRCPACGIDFIQKCARCGTKMKPGWQFCPICSEADESKGYTPSTTPSEPAPPGDLRRGSVDIDVTDTETGLPLRGANVVIHGPCELGGSTNPRGVFALHRLVDGDYIIEVTKDGYTSEKHALRITDLSHESLSIALKPMLGKIAGRTTDCATGRPIAGALVYLDTNRIDRVATSNDQGAYVLEEVPHGDYALIADSSGYETHSRLVEVRPGHSTVADLSLVPAETTVDEEEKTNVV